jgi:DNA-binding NarL/FixJ family response regulator
MRVLLVDDHPLLLDGLRTLLEGRGVEVAGVARNGLEALDQARALAPDVILMDIQMPLLDGLAATRLIKAEMPDVRIVMLTMSGQENDLFEAIKSGACGYLLKSQDTGQFFAQLQALAQGEVVFSPGLAERVLQEFGRQAASNQTAAAVEKPGDALQARQIEVLTLVAGGMTYKEVGKQLGLSEHTIKYHMSEIVQRLHLENRAQVIDYARRMGLSR